MRGEVGIFEDARYPEGEPVAQRAYWHEYGTGVPERPFFRPTMAAKANEWGKLAERGSAKVMEGTLSASSFYEVLAEKAASDVKETITAMKSPPLNPRTIAKKGFATLLVDTATMRNAIKGKVEVGQE